MTRAIFVALLLAVAALFAQPAHAQSTAQERAAQIGWQGYSRLTLTAASIPITAGGTAVVTSGAAERGKICLYVLPDVTALIYIGTGTVSATAMIAAIGGTGSRMWCEYLPRSVVIKALSSSGTVAVYASEYAF